VGEADDGDEESHERLAGVDDTIANRGDDAADTAKDGGEHPAVEHIEVHVGAAQFRCFEMFQCQHDKGEQGEDEQLELRDHVACRVGL
ncbi:uncharacterized protein METZ01_LOCUS421294, partial [marine metagenome]